MTEETARTPSISKHDWETADPEELEYFVPWMSALTSQGLHDKSDIAIVLALFEREVAALTEELDARKGDPVTRLHNICQGLEYDKKDSPYSAEAWDLLVAENDELRKQVAALTTQLDQAAAYILEAGSNQIGSGDDPIGFLIASHRYVADQLRTAEAELDAAKRALADAARLADTWQFPYLANDLRALAAKSTKPADQRGGYWAVGSDSLKRVWVAADKSNEAEK